MPHIEVLQTAVSAPAPGWAYVVDRGIDPSKTALNPTGARKGKRAVRIAASAADGTELTRREQVAITKRLTDLDKDGGKEIEIPRKWKDIDWGSGKSRKMTTNVRRILTSEKTFAHHLADEEAARALKASEAASSGRPAARDARKSLGTMGPPATPTTPAAQSTTPAASLLDDDPLLQVAVPTMPSAEEIEALLSAPALPYNEARAAPPLPPSEGGPPQRHFCELCGYWGQVRCMKCGARVCGLKCKTKHDDECKQRFA